MEPGTSAEDKCFHFSPSLLTLQCSSELSQLLGFVQVTAPRGAEMIQPRTLSLWGCSASLPMGKLLSHSAGQHGWSSRSCGQSCSGQAAQCPLSWSHCQVLMLLFLHWFCRSEDGSGGADSQETAALGSQPVPMALD